MLLRLLQWAEGQLAETAAFPRMKDMSTAELFSD
jgi:hypothetical protein